MRDSEKALIEEVEKLKKENENLHSRIDRMKEMQEIMKSINSRYEEIIEKSGITLADEIDRDKIQMFESRQQRIFQNKVNHGFNTTNIYQEARYILEEVAELMRAIEKNDRENMIEELADIIIFAYGCAEVARLGNLDDKIFEKMDINESRKYTQNNEGDFVKTQN